MSSLKCPTSLSSRNSSHHHGRPRNFLAPSRKDAGGSNAVVGTRFTKRKSSSGDLEEVVSDSQRPPLLRRLSSAAEPIQTVIRSPPPSLPPLLTSELAEEEDEEDGDADVLNDTSCEDYVEWPLDKDMVRDDEVVSEEDFHISDESAVLTALRIPENILPTSHTQFIESLSKKGGGGLVGAVVAAAGGGAMPVDDERMEVVESIMMGGEGNVSSGVDIKTESGDSSNSSSVPPSIILGGSVVSIMKETDRKLRSAFAKYKKLDEADRCKLEKLGDNKILVNGSTIVERDYENYTRESDVVLEMDEDWKKCSMPPLPPPTAPNCQAPPCRLGCICESIIQDSIARTHCGKPKCFFECNCLLTVFPNGDDGDIRSRLRPRVSLLNWRYMEPTEREKEPPVNYRQLERGAAIYPRMRRVAVAPQRFRNEFVMAHKFNKDSFRRERRAATNSLKFIRKTPLKRDTHTKMYRPSYGMRSAASSVQVISKETIPAKLRQCKPCTVTIDPISSLENKTLPTHTDGLMECPGSEKPPEQLEVPNLIQIMTEDGQVILMGNESMCFFAWTIHSKHPRAVIYNSIQGDILPIPWLYVPIPSSGEAWLFHQLPSKPESLLDTNFIFIPEINATIHAKALLNSINKAQESGKGMHLRIEWVGENSRQFTGSMYIFPQLPRVLLCGPFPKSQLRMRGGPGMCSTKIDTLRNACRNVKQMTTKRYIGDHHMWNSISSRTTDLVYESLMAQVEEDEARLRECNLIHEYDDPASNEMAFQLHSDYQRASRAVNQKLGYENSEIDSYVIPPDDLKVSWTDAARMLSARSTAT